MADDLNVRGTDDPRDILRPDDRRDERRWDDRRDERRWDDPRDERIAIDTPGATFARKSPATFITVAYTLLALDLLASPSRWENTPAYGVLLDILPQWAWGVVLLTLALLLAVATWLTDHHAMSVVAHLAAITFTGGWMAAFIARRITDNGTTAMNPVTWALILAVLIHSMRATERYRRTIVSRDERQ